MATTPRRSIRRWFQFGLKPVILLTVVCAIALTWWRRPELVAELEATRERMRKLEDEARTQQAFVDVYRALIADGSKHQAAFELLVGTEHVGQSPVGTVGIDP